MKKTQEENLRVKIADVIGDMSEAILRRKPPFDDLSVQEEVYAKTQMKFYHYCNEIEENERNEFLKCLVDLSRYTIKDLILGGQKPFDSIFPGHKENWKRLTEWSKTKNNDFLKQELTQHTERISSKELTASIRQILKIELLIIIICREIKGFKV